MGQPPKDPLVAAAAGAVLTICGALHVAERLAVSGDELAAAVGATVVLVTLLRDWHLKRKARQAAAQEGES